MDNVDLSDQLHSQLIAATIIDNLPSEIGLALRKHWIKENYRQELLYDKWEKSPHTFDYHCHFTTPENEKRIFKVYSCNSNWYVIQISH